MSANNIEIIINEVVVVAEAVEPELELPVTMAELLEEDFTNDDEAEFLQGVLSIQQDIENVILSDNPEDFLLPTEDDLPPALLLLEKIDELKAYKFGDRTLARMERRIRGVNDVVKEKFTETDKASHPDYKKCPECLRHFTKRYLGFHMGTDICVKVKTAHNLRPSGSDKKKVSEKIYNACYDLEDLFARAVAYKKNIEPELKEEVIGDENAVALGDDIAVWVIKTYEYNHTTETIDYAGLWEDSETGNKEFKTEEEAREAFGYATEGDKGYISVELVLIDPTKNEDRETIIEEWEDNIDEYIVETAKRHIKVYYSNSNTNFYEYNGDVEWDFDDREVDEAFKLAKEWSKSQDGIESICVVETYSDGSSEILCKYNVEEM